MDRKPTFKHRPNGLAEDLGAVLGLSRTLVLCATRGGRQLYVPEAMNERHFLYNLVGETAFRRMIDEWGGETISVPMLSDFGRYQRIRKAAELHVQGKSLHLIAALTGVTYQQAKNDRRTAEELGLIPLVLTADRRVKSDAEVIHQMGFDGF